MRSVSWIPLALACFMAACASRPASTGGQQASPPGTPRAADGRMKWGLVLHGGAGVIHRGDLTPEREAAVRADLERALRAGHAVLAAGGESLDAVTAAVVVLEDSPLFNAGKGAVFTNDGRNELDAAVMRGDTLQAGSVAGLTRVKNPVLLARAVMERSKHVMMIGAGAEEFARLQGVEFVDPSYFFSEERWRALQKARAAEADGGTPATDGGQTSTSTRDAKFGTVGAVALDHAGRLAAATSTGGMTNKRYGRVGDVPIIGAGTYANARCAVSATGHGEYFIRYTVAHDLCARVVYANASLADAAHTVINDVLVKAGGEGGVVALDADGHFTLTFNSPGMYRGYVGEDGVPHVAIFRDPVSAVVGAGRVTDTSR